jgi:UDP-glucose 4-epimerase
VYGAHGRNPNYLREDHALQPNPSLGWLRDKVQAEGHAREFARRFPGMCVTVLRMAPLLGPEVRNFYTRLLERRLLPVPMGYDPLLQLLHPEDALDALEAALESGPAGPVNVVPRSVITLRTLLHIAGKVPVAVPHPAAYAAADLLWAAGLGAAPAGFVDYARFRWVADGARACELMGFEASHTSREALDAWLRYRYPARQRTQLAGEAQGPA